MQAGPYARIRAPHARNLARGVRALAASLVVLAGATAGAISVANAAPSPAKSPAAQRLAQITGAARPAERSKPGKPARPVKLAKGTLEKLASKNDTEVLAALDTIRLAGPGAVAAAPDLAALLDRGTHREVTVVTLETLGELGPSETARSIVPYTGHRELSIRRAAVLALDGIHAHGEQALAALRRALGDADEEVRASAARGLAQPEAAPLAGDLVRAMDHKVAHSGLALGVACSGDTCVELAARLDNSAADTEASAGLDRLVDRADLPDETKMRVLEKIGSSHTQAARVYLASLRAGERWPRTASPALTKARDAALTEASGVR